MKSFKWWIAVVAFVSSIGFYPDSFKMAVVTMLTYFFLKSLMYDE